jgi:colanic acid/amylovoran biosynthesis glycosyltransferase
MTNNVSALPVVASYCATFLKPEMLHIYRQITSLERVRPVVLAQKRECADRFPFPHLHLVRRSRAHFFRHFWYRKLRGAPWRVSQEEIVEARRILDETQAQLLHIYFGHIAVHLLPLIRQWDGPSIVSFHGADVGVDLQRPAYLAATREMLAAVRRVLVRSESLRRALIELGCAPAKLELQRTGIPLRGLPLRERNAPTDGAWRLLQASRLIEKKGLKTTLRAFARFRETFPHAKLIIAGEGPQRNELVELGRRLEADDGIQFVGFLSQPELRELFYSSHLFLHPSETAADGNQEGVPNAMLEAMASGLPIFATRHGGIPEAVEEGVSGILVAERDHQSLSRALIDFAKTPERLPTMGRAAAEAVARHFDQATQTRRLEEIYLREISLSSRAKARDPVELP